MKLLRYYIAIALLAVSAMGIHPAAAQFSQRINPTAGRPVAATLDGSEQLVVSQGGVPKAVSVASFRRDPSYVYAAPVTGATVTIPATSSFAMIDPAGTIAALTVALPACSATYDGKIAGFSTTQTITALTISPTVGTMSANAPTTLTAGAVARFICRGSTGIYYRS